MLPSIAARWCRSPPLSRIGGTAGDGHAFIDTAIEKGAAAIICEDLPKHLKEGVTYVRVADSRHALAIMAGNYHGHPDQKLKLIGITGTNGKTSVATLLYKLFGKLGHKSGLLSPPGGDPHRKHGRPRHAHHA